MRKGRLPGQSDPAQIIAEFTGATMEPDDSTTFAVSNCEVSAIPGTGYAFIRLTLTENCLSDSVPDRRYVLSCSQLAQLKDEIDSVLRLWRDPISAESPISNLH
ncbi:MAG: hypothetical protein ACT4PS_13240 [Betaproteobacteria bacterium]